MDTPKPLDPSRSEVAHIGKSVLIKGELSGSEDLYFDGEIEGSIDLGSHSLTIGPNGRIRANVRAKDVVVNGKVDGDVSGSERVELRRSALMVGNIVTRRVVIEEGAFFKGQLDIQREAAKEIPKEVPRAAAQSAAASTPATAGAPQGTLVDTKR
ncbi:MAG TPA: polymer-forming cytoskeletal protein [Terriglobales bacterium]|nr:polymer-forming cytoskeletal protein [Terriglobales bacterium]